MELETGSNRLKKHFGSFLSSFGGYTIGYYWYKFGNLFTDGIYAYLGAVYGLPV